MSPRHPFSAGNRMYFFNDAELLMFKCLNPEAQIREANSNSPTIVLPVSSKAPADLIKAAKGFAGYAISRHDFKRSTDQDGGAR